MPLRKKLDITFDGKHQPNIGMWLKTKILADREQSCSYCNKSDGVSRDEHLDIFKHNIKPETVNTVN